MPYRKEITDEDRKIITKAAECANNNRTDIDEQLFNFMAEVLQGNVPGELEAEFVERFQQFTSPVMAKGVEDTAFYCYNRLTALNEVGGNPACSGFSLEDFHNYNSTIQRTFPSTMLTLSTHDTKRADDVRARLSVLSEVPDAFADKANHWHEMTSSYRSEQVDAGTEWFLFQTLVGAWPITLDRIKNYMQKAMREAKVRTTWTSNNSEYEDALNAYLEKLLEDKAFTSDLASFVAEITAAGRINSLAQTLLKHTSPGVPDMYQGGELWDLSLVDPDNRRPVDYKLRSDLLNDLSTLDTAGIMARMDDGLPKLWLVHKALTLRQQHPEWFGADAAYTPLQTSGPDADRLVAFQRGDSLLTVVPRWMQGASSPDASLHLPGGTWTNVLTGETLAGGLQRATDLLTAFPVALLVRS